MKMTKWLFIPALLAVAAMVFIGCPSQPDPPPDSITDPDILLKNGIYLVEHTIAIANNAEYEVLIDVTSKDRDDPYELAIDYYLWGCHFQAELYYTLPSDPTKKYLQANNKNSNPANISDYERKYRVTLKAGDMGLTQQDKDDAVNIEGYTLTTAENVAAPAGATQYLRLLAKTPNWYRMGVPYKSQRPNPPNAEDNWDFNYYGNSELGFNGSVIVQKKPVYNYEAATALEVNEDKDSSGKGNITSTEFDKLRDLPVGSRVKVTYTVELVASDGGGDTCQAGWGFAEFGTNMDNKKIRGQNLNVDIVVPQDVTTIGDYNGVAYVLVEDIISASDPDWTFFNVYNGATITKLEIEKATGLAP